MRMLRIFNSKGFLLIDILIAGLIISGSIAAAMYLFRTGFENLEIVNTSNVLSVKLTDAVNYLRSIDLKKHPEGTENFGDNVVLQWNSKLIEKTRPLIVTAEGTSPAPYEIYLYEVNFKLSYKNTERSYVLNVFKYETLVKPEEIF